MITLNNFLTKMDYEFASIFLKILGYKRDKRDVRELEKIITKLAEQGQVESIEYYFKTLSPIACLNTKIVANIFKLEKKFVKQPRDLMALFAYAEAKEKSRDYGYNKRIEIEDLPQNNLSKKYYDGALNLLSKIASIDCIAAEYLFKAKNSANKGVEYLRELSNFRNKLYVLANKQINEDKKLKYLYAFAKNLIEFAPENEFKNKLNLVNKIIGDLQKNCLIFNATKNT